MDMELPLSDSLCLEDTPIGLFAHEGKTAPDQLSLAQGHADATASRS
jgi:hypothetical protein